MTAPKTHLWIGDDCRGKEWRMYAIHGHFAELVCNDAVFSFSAEELTEAANCPGVNLRFWFKKKLVAHFDRGANRAEFQQAATAAARFIATGEATP